MAEMLPNREVLLTRKDNRLYVHLFGSPRSDAVILAPIDTMPQRAVVLNTGEPVSACVDLLPAHFHIGKEYLRLCNLPVNDLAGTVMVVQLDFEEFSAISALTADERDGLASNIPV